MERVPEEDQTLLKFLVEQNILPEKNVFVVEASPSRGIIMVKTDAGESSLGYVVAKRISVSKA